MDLGKLGVGQPHTILRKRQLEVDPLSVVFSNLDTPLDEFDCWVSKLAKQQQRARDRTYLFTQLNGKNFQHNRKTRATCGNKQCINPWHAERYGPHHPPEWLTIQHPEHSDRPKLLLWYAAGNSPVTALDVDDVKKILAAAEADVRHNAWGS